MGMLSYPPCSLNPLLQLRAGISAACVFTCIPLCPATARPLRHKGTQQHACCDWSSKCKACTGAMKTRVLSGANTSQAARPCPWPGAAPHEPLRQQD